METRKKTNKITDKMIEDLAKFIQPSMTVLISRRRFQIKRYCIVSVKKGGSGATIIEEQLSPEMNKRDMYMFLSGIKFFKIETLPF